MFQKPVYYGFLFWYNTCGCIGDYMEIKRSKNQFNCFDYSLMNDGKELKVIYAGNLDLYFMVNNGKSIPYAENVNISFDITKEDYEIFCLFESLYNEVISGNVFEDCDYNSYGSYQYKLLVDDEQSINWISDDGPAECEDRLSFMRIDNDTYRLIFYRNNVPMDFGFKSSFNIVVRFRNSGSRYDPFNCVFMRFYQRLQEVDPNYHQVHIEELLYKKQLNKK